MFIFSVFAAIIVAITEIAIIKEALVHNDVRDDIELAKIVQKTSLVTATLVWLYAYFWVMPQDVAIQIDAIPLMILVGSNIGVFILATVWMACHRVQVQRERRR